MFYRKTCVWTCIISCSDETWKTKDVLIIKQTPEVAFQGKNNTLLSRQTLITDEMQITDMEHKDVCSNNKLSF